MYDFGDSWLHQLIVEEQLPPEKDVDCPVCVAGQRACPPEDCGGPWGYARLLEEVSTSDQPEDEEALEWLGDSFDPEKFDLAAVNRQLRQLRTRKRR